MIRVVFGLLLVLASTASAGPTTLPTAQSMSGKVFAGYQGWFAPTVPGTNLRWVHFGSGGKFEPGTSAIEMWPDTTGFDADELVPTDFRHADGSVAHVFSSAHSKTVDRHFDWMRQYGIDGAFLQRFAVTLKSPVKRHADIVLANVRAASQKHQRAYAIMYDLSGLQQGDLMKVVAADWKTLIDDQHITADPSYLHHNGRPVVAVWGIGFSDGRKYTLDESMELVKFLKSYNGGATVVLGVPYWWRGLHRDAVSDPKLLDVLKTADVISPWAVGRLRTTNDAANRVNQVLAPDIAWTKENKLAYLPVVFPGFGWNNLQKLRGKEATKDAIDRQGGKFLWSQVVAAKKAGAEMLYIAMFDEIDEGTAIMKVSNNPPVGETKFQTYGDLPSDHYLWLTGEAGRVIRGESPAAELPERKQPH
jgi:hypothetical protein